MPRALRDQVVVITGASSGIGRATAQALARHGALVVLAARNESVLRDVATEVEQAGGTGHVVVTDVAEWVQVERLAQAAVDRFGRIDTWINSAGVNIYATVEDLTIEEIERVIQVNQLGQIYGMKAVLPQLIQQGYGTVITVAAAAATRSVPLQAPYSSAAHGIRGFTEALRLELAREHPEINLTLIMPGSVNTPFFRRARSKLGVSPKPLLPIHEPEAVVEVILDCCQRRRRDVFTTPMAEVQEVLDALDPSLLDWFRTRNGRAFTEQQADEPDDGQDALFTAMPSESYATRGDWGNVAKASSLYVRYLQLHPNLERVLTGGVVLGALALIWLAGKRTAG